MKGKKKILNELRQKKFIASVPVIVKFRRLDNSLAKFKATKGTEVVKWKDILKVFREMRI